ncbi:MAG: hypothetical protein GXO35_02635, partial [Gammaproteobacteria bacterium]|nr:hypothetical protein [Gammaproteobacteria bacterium]
FEFYTQFVFKHIEYFEDEQIAEHLYFLYNNYLRDRRNEKAREIPPNAEYYRREFLKELRQLAFLRDKSGELHQPSYFFSRDNEFFFNMCEERLAPNLPECLQFRLPPIDWSDFLNKVGIVKEVTGELFVSLAKQLASDAETKEDKFLKSLRRKSEVMTNYLFERMELKELEKFCEQISAIKFIAQHRVADHLSALAPQRCPDRFVAFSGSAPVKYERLLWTTTSLLPAWADPSRRNDLKKLAQHLKVVDTAPVDMVADNLTCVATELSKNWCDQYLEPVVLDVFRCNYSLLDDVEAIPSDVVGRLSNEKIIIMTADHRLTKPNRTVANLSESDEIKPYLCRVPANISQFVSLFERLGMSKSVTADQYVTVLSDIKAEVGEEPLKDEHREATRKAVCGLFGQLSDRNKPAPCTGQVLYLPDEDDRLVDVCRLAFNDAPAFYCRMRKIQYVMDVSQYGLDVTAVSRCLKLLPGRMRPTFLSECVSEELVSGIAEGARDDKGTARLLNEKLSSLEFNTMVDRLMYHEAVCSQQNVDPQSLADLSQRLSVTRVFAVNCVRTQLKYKKVIPDSESTKICFVQRISEPRSELTKWHIYVDERYDLQMELLVPLADIVDKILDGRLRKSALYLLPLLANSTDKSLAEILDEFNITKH